MKISMRTFYIPYILGYRPRSGIALRVTSLPRFGYKLHDADISRIWTLLVPRQHNKHVSQIIHALELSAIHQSVTGDVIRSPALVLPRVYRWQQARVGSVWSRQWPRVRFMTSLADTLERAVSGRVTIISVLCHILLEACYSHRPQCIVTHRWPVYWCDVWFTCLCSTQALLYEWSAC